MMQWKNGLRWLVLGMLLVAGSGAGAQEADSVPSTVAVSPAIQETYDFLKRCPAFFIATDEDGQPRVRPFGALGIWEGRLYIQTGNFKAVYRQMMKNPKVELCALTSEGTEWVRVTAEVVRDNRLEARQAVLDLNPGLKNLYAADDGRCEVFYLKDAQVVFSSFAAEARTVRF